MQKRLRNQISLVLPRRLNVAAAIENEKLGFRLHHASFPPMVWRLECAEQCHWSGLTWSMACLEAMFTDRRYRIIFGL